MGFWSGIKTIGNGLVEIIESSSEMAKGVRGWKRKKLSGKYVINIDNYGCYQGDFVAYITYHGESNTHDIDRLTYKGRSQDIWDTLDEGARRMVGIEINMFLNILLDKNNASPYE